MADPKYSPVVVEAIGVPPVVGLARMIDALWSAGVSEDELDDLLAAAGDDPLTQLNTIHATVRVEGSHT